MKRAAAALAAAALVGCVVPHFERAARSRRVHDALAAAALAPTGTVVRLDTLAPFAWDTAWVFEPYTGLGGRSSAREAAALRAAAPTGIADRDDINVLVLMRGAEPATVVIQERAAGDFALARAPAPMPRARAVLRVCRVAGERQGTFVTDAGPPDWLLQNALRWRCS